MGEIVNCQGLIIDKDTPMSFIQVLASQAEWEKIKAEAFSYGYINLLTYTRRRLGLNPETADAPAPVQDGAIDFEEVARLRRENENAGDVITRVAMALGGTSSNADSMLGRIAKLKQEALANKAIVGKLRRKLEPKKTSRWDRTVDLFTKSWWGDDEQNWRPEHRGLGNLWGLGIIRHRNRHFLPGDVAIVGWINGGGERQSVWCYTGRGHAINGLYLQYARYNNRMRTDRTILKLVECPDHLTGLMPGDPAVRRFVVETLCAGDAAPG